MAVGGAILKVSATVLRAVQFLVSLAILAIFAYFLVYLQQHEITVLTFVRAVTGISGAAALYTLVAFFLTCCLGGVTVFAFAGIALDICFAAAFVAVAVLTKDGNTNCSAVSGGASSLYSDTNHVVALETDAAQRICNMYRGAFVLSIIALVLFLVTAVFQWAMGRAHQRDKRRGIPEKGPKFPFFSKKNRTSKATQRDMEHGAVPVGDHHNAPEYTNGHTAAPHHNGYAANQTQHGHTTY